MEVGLRSETVGASVLLGDLGVDVVGTRTRDGGVSAWVFLDVDLSEFVPRHAELEASRGLAEVFRWY